MMKISLARIVVSFVPIAEIPPAASSRGRLKQTLPQFLRNFRIFVTAAESRDDLRVAQTLLEADDVAIIRAVRVFS